MAYEKVRLGTIGDVNKSHLVIRESTKRGGRLSNEEWDRIYSVCMESEKWKKRGKITCDSRGVVRINKPCLMVAGILSPLGQVICPYGMMFYDRDIKMFKLFPEEKQTKDNSTFPFRFKLNEDKTEVLLVEINMRSLLKEMEIPLPKQHYCELSFKIESGPVTTISFRKLYIMDQVYKKEEKKESGE
jgi:hypothetical protein